LTKANNIFIFFRVIGGECSIQSVMTPFNFRGKP